MMPTGRDATWAVTTMPRSLASVIAASRSRHVPGRVGTWVTEIDSGRPEASAIPSTAPQLVVGVGEVGHDLEHALPGAPDGRRRCRRARRRPR